MKNVFDKYLEGLEKKRAGDKKGAAAEIGQIFGGEGSTPIIDANVDRFYKTGSAANRAITGCMFGAERSRRRKSKK
jgi:hypothetical protein